MQQNNNDKIIDWSRQNSVHLENPAKSFCLIIFLWKYVPYNSTL
jgi:hypothetical protein